MEAWTPNPVCTNFKAVYERYEQYVPREIEGVYITQALNELVNHWKQGDLQPKEHEVYFAYTALPKIASRMVRTRYINETLTRDVYFFIRKTISIAIEQLPHNIPAYIDFLLHAFDHSSSFYSSKNLPVQYTIKFADATFPAPTPPTSADAKAPSSPPTEDKTAPGATDSTQSESTDSLDVKSGDEPEVQTPPQPKEMTFDEEPDNLNPYASIYGSTLHYPSQFFPDLINFFGALGGFAVMFKHMANESTPVATISSLLHTLRNMCTGGFMLPRRIAQFTPKIMTLAPFTKGLSISQLKSAKKEDLESMLRHLSLFLKLTLPSEQASDHLDKLGLNIAAQCLSSGILTQRLFALSFIGSAIETVQPSPSPSRAGNNNSNHNDNTSAASTIYSTTTTTIAPADAPSAPPAERWLNVANLIEWIQNSQILVNIFGDSSHSQLLKNCGKLLRFLAQNEGGLSVSDVELIWKCGSNSHESLAKDALNVFFDTCGYLSPLLAEPVLASIESAVNTALSTVSNSELSQNDDTPLPLTAVELNNIAILANQLASDSQRLRLIQLLLKIVRESPVHIVTETTPHLVDIFRAEWFRPYRLEMLSELLKVLQEGTLPTRSFFCSLIDPIVGSWTSDDPSTASSLEAITEQLGKPLEDFLIEELERFKEACRPFVTEETYGSEYVALAGCTTYLKELQNRLYLLYHIFVNGQGRLTRDSLFRLWDTLYFTALHYSEVEEAAEWFKAASGQGTHAITPSLADQLFQGRFIQLDFTQFSPNMFSCFERFFMHSNSVMQNLTYIPAKPGQQQSELDFEVSTHPDKLIGEACLWDIALTNPDTNVVQACMKLLVKCMENLNPTLQLEISPVELREHFIGKCLGRIPKWVEEYKSLSSAEEHVDTSMTEHKMQLEKYISNALYLLVHLMDSLEPAASKRSTITRGLPLSIRIQALLETPTTTNPGNTINVSFSISCHSSTTFAGLQALISSRLAPLLKKHGIASDELIYVQTYPSYRRLDHDVSIADASLSQLELFDRDAINVLRLPSVAGRETVLRSRVGTSAFKNDEKTRPTDAEARIQQICEFADWSPDLAEFALKSHGWNVEQVGNNIMDEARRMKLLNEAKKAGVGKNQPSADGNAAPSGEEILTIMKQRTDAVLTIMDNNQSTDVSLPSNILSQSSAHFDALFNLLTLNNDSVSTAVWQIILRIPTSVSIKGALLSTATPNWPELLPLDVYRLSYTVQIIDQILCPLDDSWSVPRRLEWAMWFQETGGINQLFKVVSHFETGPSFLPLDPESSELPLSVQTRRDCLTTLLKILDVFMTCYAQSMGLGRSEDDIPAELSTDVIENIVDPSLPENACPDTAMLAPEHSDLRDAYTSHLKQSKALLLPLDCDAALKHLREVLVWGTTSKPQIANGAFVGYTWRCFVNLTLTANARSKLLVSSESVPASSKGPAQVSLLSAPTLKTALDLLTDLNADIRRETATNLLHLATLQPPAADALLKHLLHSLPGDSEVQTADLSLAECYDRLYWLLELLIKRRLNQLEQDKPGSLFGDAVVQEFGALAERMISCIKERPVVETGALSHVDHLLNGSARVLTSILSAWPTEYPVPEFISIIYNTCMFTAKTGGNVSPKCKTHASRTSTYELLLQLSRLSEHNKLQLLTLLNTNHNEPYVRMSKWDFHPGNEDKSAAGYVGLVNLGATCYMNSLLQQFYMMPQLRKDLLAAPIVLGPEETLKENMVYQFHQLFGNLQETAKAAHNPKEFTGSYRDIEGNRADVNMQQDVSEFFSVVCGTLESLLKNTVDEKLLQRNFGCVQVSQIKSMEPEYPFFSEREEELYSIPLDVRLKSNFNDAMDLFVKQDVLEGDNKYKCDEYGRHIVATKGNLIQKMSNTLIFHLMRFDWDVATYRKRKLNELFNFPTRINMKKWTKSGQAQLAAEANGTDASALAAEYPEAYYEYQLTGILVHTGSADSGHYYSFIKERDAPHKWYQFNDRVVSEFDPASIPQECFGGYHSVKEWDSQQQKDVWRSAPTERSAYMLFYERVTPLPSEPSPAPPSADPSSTLLPGNRRILLPHEYEHGVPSDVYNKVWDENASFLKVRQVYDPAYFEFMREYAALWNFEPFLHITPEDEKDIATDAPVLASTPPAKKPMEEDEEEPAMDEKKMELENVPVNVEFAAIKTMTRLIFEVVSHSKDNFVLTSLLNQLSQMISNHIPATVWLIEYIRRNNLIKELLLSCHVERTRIAFLDFFRQLMQSTVLSNVSYVPAPITTKAAPGSSPHNVANSPSGTPSEPPAPSPAENVFISAALDLLEESRGAWRRFKQYFGLIHEFASLGVRQCEFLIKKGLIPTYVDYFMGQSTGTVARVRVMDEDNFPDLVEFIATITAMVCSCKNESPSDNDATGLMRSRLQSGDLELPATAKHDLYDAKEFFTSLLEMDYNSPSTGDMLEHICWRVKSRSDYVIDHLLTKIGVKPSENKAPVLEYLLYRVLSIEDELQAYRIERVLGDTESRSSIGSVTLGSKMVRSLLRSAQSSSSTHTMLYMIGYLRLIETIPQAFQHLAKHPINLLALRRFWRQQFGAQFPTVPYETHLAQDAKEGLYLYFSAAAELAHPRHPAHLRPLGSKSFDDHFNSLEPWKRSLPYVALAYCTHIAQAGGNLEPAYEDIVLAQQQQIVQMEAQMEEMKRERKTLGKALKFVHSKYPTAKLSPKLESKVSVILADLFPETYGIHGKYLASPTRSVTSITYLTAASSGNAVPSISSSSGGASSNAPIAATTASGPTSPKSNQTSPSHSRTPALTGEPPASPMPANVREGATRTMSMSGAMDGDEEVLGIQSYPQRAPDTAVEGATSGNVDEIEDYFNKDLSSANNPHGLVSSDGSSDQAHQASPQSSGEYDPESFNSSIPGWKTGIMGPGIGIMNRRPMMPDEYDDFDLDGGSALHGPAPIWRTAEPRWNPPPADWEERVNNLKSIGLCDDDEVLKLLLEDNNWSVETAANELFDPDTISKLQRKIASKESEQQSTEAGSDVELDNGEVIRKFRP